MNNNQTTYGLAGASVAHRCIICCISLVASTQGRCSLHSFILVQSLHPKVDVVAQKAGPAGLVPQVAGAKVHSIYQGSVGAYAPLDSVGAYALYVVWVAMDEQ